MTDTTPTAPQDALIADLREAAGSDLRHKAILLHGRLVTIDGLLIDAANALLAGRQADDELREIGRLEKAALTPPVTQAASAQGESVGMEDVNKWLVVPREPDGKEHDAAWAELKKPDFDRIRQRLSMEDGRALFKAIGRAMRLVHTEASMKHNPEIYVGDRLAFLGHALFMRNMNVEGRLICEAIEEMAKLNGKVRALRTSDGWNRDMSKAPRDDQWRVFWVKHLRGQGGDAVALQWRGENRYRDICGAEWKPDAFITTPIPSPPTPEAGHDPK